MKFVVLLLIIACLFGGGCVENSEYMNDKTINSEVFCFTYCKDNNMIYFDTYVNTNLNNTDTVILCKCYNKFPIKDLKEKNLI